MGSGRKGKQVKSAEKKTLLPSYSPKVTRMASGDAHTNAAPGWPATFEAGVDARMMSPAAMVHKHPESFNEQTRILHPPEFGETHGTSSFRDAVFNAINVLLGVGVLSSPFALRSSGFLVGIPLFLFFTFVTNHTGKLLGKCLDYQEGMQTYPDIGEAAFGTKGRILISVTFFLELFFATAMFNVLIGDTLAALIPSYSESELVVLAFLVIMPTLWTTHLSMLSYFSILGILSSFFCLYAVFYVGFAIDITAPNYTAGSLPHPQPLELVASAERIPLAIGLTMVAFGGHSVFPSICSSLANRSEYPRVLDLTYLIVGFVYAAIEVAGYCMFGTETKKEITLNLIDSFPGKLTQLVVWTIALNPMSKIAITIHPVALAIEEFLFTRDEMQASSTKVSCYRAFVRTTIGILALLCALYVPHFARLTSFLGSFFAMMVSVFLPCVCYVTLFQHRLSRFEIGLNIGLAVLSIIFTIVGTVASFLSPAD